MNKKLVKIAKVFEKYDLSYADALNVYSRVIAKIAGEGGDTDVVGLVEGLEGAGDIDTDDSPVGGLPEEADEIASPEGLDDEGDIDKTDAVKDEIMDLLEDLEDSEIEEILESVSDLIGLTGEEEQQSAGQTVDMSGGAGSTITGTPNAPTSEPYIADAASGGTSPETAVSTFTGSSGMSDWSSLGVNQ